MFKHSDFTKEERDACLYVVGEILYCSNLTRKEGILSLEKKYIPECESYFMRLMLQLIVDGTDPDIVKEIGETLIASENHTGAALLERVLILRGVLSVQEGVNPQIIEAMLMAHLGEDYMKARGIPENSTTLSTIACYAREEPLPESAEFDRILQTLSDRDLEEVLRKADKKTIALAMKGCGKEAARKAGKNLSPARENAIAWEMLQLGINVEKFIPTEQAAIAGIICRFSECGYILMDKEDRAELWRFIKRAEAQSPFIVLPK